MWQRQDSSTMELDTRLQLEDHPKRHWLEWQPAIIRWSTTITIANTTTIGTEVSVYLVKSRHEAWQVTEVNREDHATTT